MSAAGLVELANNFIDNQYSIFEEKCKSSSLF